MLSPCPEGASGRQHWPGGDSTQMISALSISPRLVRLWSGMPSTHPIRSRLCANSLIHPIILGRGKRWFDDQAHASAFTLAQSSSTPSGVLVARYVLNGEVRTGSFA